MTTMRTFTADERYALGQQFQCGQAMADRDHQRADLHRRAARYNSGRLTHCELATAYALGVGGCEPGTWWGDARDLCGLPSPAVHDALGYLVSDAWRVRAVKVGRQLGCAEAVAAWTVELGLSDARVAVQ